MTEDPKENPIDEKSKNVCMYVKFYLTSVKNVLITKSGIYNTNLNRPRQKGIITVTLTDNSINEDPKELQDPQ